MSIAPDSILGVAVSTVTEQMDQLNQLSDKYNSELSAALSQLASIEVAPITPPQKAVAPDTPLPAVNLGQMPAFTPKNPNIPNPPSEPSIDLGVLDVNMSLPAAPGLISVNIPQAPGMQAIPVPSKPAIDTSVDLPASPQLDIPAMEALESLTLPDFQFPTLPTFDGQPPSLSGVTVPNVFINWTEPEYQSELYDELLAKVLEMMQGGTGLPAPIEDALFARARERDSAESKRQLQEAIDTWAARNFSMPPGMLAKQAEVVLEQSRLRAADLNREILIEAAKWEIENLRFAVQQGMALEQLTQNLFQNYCGRLFEAAKFQAEANIRVFDAQISLFNAQTSAFNTLAQVYRTKLDGAIAQLTAYKTAVEAQAVKGQINQQRVEVFKARLDAVLANVEIYKANMQGAAIKAEVIKNQFDAYRADIQAYAEQIGAEKVKFDAYAAQVSGEAAKASIFESQARAYAATIQGLSSQADIRVKSGQLRIEASRAKVEQFVASVDAYRARVQAGIEESRSITETFVARVEAWKAAASANVADAEMKSRWTDMNIRTNIAFNELQVTEYTARMQDAIQKAQIALESAKALGAYTAQLAAGAMSAAHVSASIGGTGSATTTDSRTETNTTSTSHNYTYNY